MNLEFILQQEFPHKKLHDTTNNNGCAARVLGEAYVFLENLISFGNITLVDLCECCWHCKKAIEETEIIEGQKTHSYTCSLNYDNHLAAYIAEITILGNAGLKPYYLLLQSSFYNPHSSAFNLSLFFAFNLITHCYFTPSFAGLSTSNSWPSLFKTSTILVGFS